MEKIEIRKLILKKLNSMSDEEYRSKSAKVRQSLMADPAFINASSIGVTISAYPEVDTLELIETCWKLNKKVAVPKCTPESKRMEFYIIEDFNQLETVYMKLKEPIISKTQHVAAEEIDLMIVPGVVFSRRGYRIGFGGGYFDRYLSEYVGKTRSLAFQNQLVETVPVEAHDIPVDGIHTEDFYIDTKQVKA
ncbi:MAG TPA: 5-formyltetrahydrofolate cyclo-ligase [Planococcus sp. (in: firmicutes)]|nr:5-formyltetrahydrofolate cyclo-ligase [Planococcus sp. (in: firmicutes)]